VDFTGLTQEHVSEDEEEAVRLGPIERVMLGYSRTDQFDGVSSSGGIIRALIRRALAEGIPVVCLAEDGGGYSAQRLESVSDIGRIPGSIYHSVSFARGIELLRQSHKPCLLVAIPCVLEGLDKYIAVSEPSLQAKIHMRLGLICGWMYSDHSWKSLAHYKKIPGVITDIRYRGEDKVGRLKLFGDDKVYTYSRREFDTFGEEVQFKSSYSRVFNRRRCRLCENHVNQLCDIAVGDAWLKRYRERKDKLSLVVVRSAKGEAALQALLATGDIVLETGRIGDIVESQSRNLVFGEQARKYNSYLGWKGRFAPEFVFSGNREQVVLSVHDRIAFAVEEAWRYMIKRRAYRAYYRWMCIKLLPQYIRRRLVTMLRSIFGGA